MTCYTDWLQEHCDAYGLPFFTKTIYDRPVNAVVSLVFFIGVLYVTFKPFNGLKTDIWAKARPQSPDPEKSSDVARFAEKRMKPTDRPFGGMAHTKCTSFGQRK